MSEKKKMNVPGIIFLCIIVIGGIYASLNEKTERQKGDIVELMEIPKSFKPSMKIVAVKHMPYASVSRVQVTLTVPDRLSKEDVLNNVKAAIIEIWKKYEPAAIAFRMFKPGDETIGVPTVAYGDFSPHGEWGRANEDVHPAHYRINITHNETYASIEIPFKVSQRVSYYGTEDLEMSRSADSWEDDQIVHRVKSGAKGIILEIKVLVLSSDSYLIRYKLHFDGKEGWVMGDGLR